MKISSVFFFRHYFSSLFIFIIELDENTDNREEHHRKKYRGGSYQNIERLCVYILCISLKEPTKSSVFS
jgi:hypothetical protein